MADQIAPRDPNRNVVIQGESSVTSGDTVNIKANPTTGRLLVDAKNLLPTVDFDYIGIVNTNTDEDTLTYKSGGSGGTSVQTLVVSYAAGAEKISDSLSALEYS